MASSLVSFGIPLLAAGLANALLFAIDRAERELGTPSPERSRRVARAGLVVFAWLAFSAFLALRGTLLDFEAALPPLLLVMASAPVLALSVGLSPVGERLARGLPLVTLVAIHGFRVPFELVLYQATFDGLLPRTLSYAGHNYEIVSGVSAALLGGLLALGRVSLWLVAAWNLLGATLLVVSIGLAVAASPPFQAFGPYQVNAWVARFPYVWVIGISGAAALGHVVLSRRLLLEAKNARRRSPAQGSR